MNKLFARQLKKATDPTGGIDVGVLSQLVIDVYEQMERDRRRSERAIALMAEELEEAAERRIEYLKHHDALTDLPNRLAFDQHLAAAIDRANPLDTRIAVVCVNLDRFKDVNDGFGRSIGDRLLKACGQRLKAVSGDAFFARVGGDEFGLLVSGSAQLTEAEMLAHRLNDAMADEFEIEGHAIRIRLSIGIALYPFDGADADALLISSGTALSHAKRDGGGSICFFDGKIEKELRDRLSLQNDLASAIDNNELALVYQPQAEPDGRVMGFEALLRWQHPTRGKVSPGVFIPIAEESGAIVAIGEWVLREACKQAASWPKPLNVAVNLSPLQFRSGDLPALVLGILIETGLAPHRLELEITEGVLIDDFARGIEVLRRLKSMGVSIAMDDFGTGYSSLKYLQAFPFDKIKIDQTFVSHLDTNEQSRAIIRAVIGLAHGLALPVLAEGVETTEQLEFLRQEGCDEIQGYLIGRPEPIECYAELTCEEIVPRLLVASAL